MSGRSVAKILLGLSLGLLTACAVFAAGIAVGAGVPALGTLISRDAAPLWPWNPDPAASDPAQSGQDELFQPFWEAWNIVHQQFVDQPVDDTQLMQGAIRGMMDALGDEHSSYMDPDEYLQANLPLDGSYEGIGAWVDTEGEYLTIVSPMPDSPAERAGLQPGDQVIGIDGQDVTGQDPSVVVRSVLGPAGSTVHLTIQREGAEAPLEFDVPRARIEIPSLETETLDGGIAYLHLFTFGEQTTDDLRAALRELLAQNPRGLIFDLRGNGGGLLATAVDVASEFIGDGVVMVERYGDGREEIYTAETGGLATEIPLVVLIDGGSASASEIVAGAIQDRGRGSLVGETSFGKGSVQQWIPLGDDAGAVRVTVARWLTPDRRQIGDVGLTPDVEVELTEEDMAAGRDPQLERARELLLEGLAATALP
ncbi:MAG: hypothetical protein A2V67_10115 [Deltaproteobacteria bacterium RBG_13_61_14]|nr:MAG: hypothetical protein A2V67_10115 [Deltaproteobacteria bacterium RBG_13_61_14]